jgi:ribosome-associated protein
MLIVNQDLRVPMWELQFSYSRSSGPGGQNVNKVNSKALLRWNPGFNRSLPPGVIARFLAVYGPKLTAEGEMLISSDESRDRLRNQEMCLEKLRQLILAVARPPKVRRKTKPTRGSQERRKDAKKRTGEIKKSRTRKDWE